MPDIVGNLITGPINGALAEYRAPNFHADEIFPIFDYSDPAAKYPYFPPLPWLTDDAGIRAPGTESKIGDYPIAWKTFTTIPYGKSTKVTKEDLAAMGLKTAPNFSLKQKALQFSIRKIDYKKEIAVKNLIIAQTWADGNSGGEDAGGLWAAGGSNTFLADVTAKKLIIWLRTGIKGSELTLAMDTRTFLSLQNEATVIAKVRSSASVTPAEITAAHIAQAAGVKNVIELDTIYSTDPEGANASTANNKAVWEANAGKGMAFLFYKSPDPMHVMGPGIQMRYKEDGKARRYYEHKLSTKHTWLYEAQEDSKGNIVSLDIGALWVDTYAT